MKFVIIKPEDGTIWETEADHHWEVYASAGLNQGAVDHGVVERGIGIVVYEYSLFAPPGQQRYFAINHGLYGGNAVLYGFDEHGETVDLVPSQLPPVLFFANEDEIEHAIKEGYVKRPQMAANGVVFWRWPEARR